MNALPLLAALKCHAAIRDAHCIPAPCNRLACVPITDLTIQTSADLAISPDWKPDMLRKGGSRGWPEKGFRI